MAPTPRNVVTTLRSAFSSSSACSAPMWSASVWVSQIQRRSATSTTVRRPSRNSLAFDDGSGVDQDGLVAVQDEGVDRDEPQSRDGEGGRQDVDVGCCPVRGDHVGAPCGRLVAVWVVGVGSVGRQAPVGVGRGPASGRADPGSGPGTGGRWWSVTREAAQPDVSVGLAARTPASRYRVTQHRARWATRRRPSADPGCAPWPRPAPCNGWSGRPGSGPRWESTARRRTR